MNTLELILSIASDVRQASLQSAVLKLAHRYRSLNRQQRIDIDDVFYEYGITNYLTIRLLHVFVVEMLNVECWMTHGSPLSDYYPIDTLVTRVESILTEHGYLDQSVTA